MFIPQIIHRPDPGDGLPITDSPGFTKRLLEFLESPEPLAAFGLTFKLLTRQLSDAEPGGSVFARHHLLIARMDQLCRSDDFKDQLDAADWDLVVVYEAHRMSAHYFGSELKKTKRYQLGELLGRHARHLLLMTATPHAGREEDFHGQ